MNVFFSLQSNGKHILRRAAALFLALTAALLPMSTARAASGSLSIGDCSDDVLRAETRPIRSGLPARRCERRLGGGRRGGVRPFPLRLQPAARRRVEPSAAGRAVAGKGGKRFFRRVCGGRCGRFSRFARDADALGRSQNAPQGRGHVYSHKLLFRHNASRALHFSWHLRALSARAGLGQRHPARLFSPRRAAPASSR